MISRHDLREIHIQPSGSAAVSIARPAATNCDAAGAICTSDGRPLSNPNSAAVAGPVGISVADARVEEGAGAVLAFAVTLSRAATSAFSVDHATSDGSARAGEDYTATSGTLSIQAGESSRTLEVAVLDDSPTRGGSTDAAAVAIRSVFSMGPSPRRRPDDGGVRALSHSLPRVPNRGHRERRRIVVGPTGASAEVSAQPVSSTESRQSGALWRAAPKAGSRTRNPRFQNGLGRPLTFAANFSAPHAARSLAAGGASGAPRCSSSRDAAKRIASSTWPRV